jgi:hypothetical protein
LTVSSSSSEDWVEEREYLEKCAQESAASSSAGAPHRCAKLSLSDAPPSTSVVLMANLKPKCAKPKRSLFGIALKTALGNSAGQ